MAALRVSTRDVGFGDPMGPAVAAELHRILGGLAGLSRRLESTIRQRSAAGTDAAADMALSNARFVGIHASQAMVNALDHLGAWKLIVDGNVHPIQAQMTLLRGALEGAVRCRWLVDANLAPATRVGRGWAAKRDDFVERRRFEEAEEGKADRPTQRGGMSAADRLRELDAARVDAEIPNVGYAHSTLLMRMYGYERWFRLASGFAHGKEWVLAATSITRSQDPSAPTGVSRGMVSASDEVVLALTRVTLQAVAQALGELEVYGGLSREGKAAP
jgi:hypothetical protein